MKKIIYYITDHGRGHATRSIAVIRELKKLNFDIVVRNSSSFEFLKKSLPKTRIINGITDVGPSINDDGISVNKNKSIQSITKWIDDVEKISNQEYSLIQKFNPDLIISDISVMPLIAGNSFKVPTLTISNFSWYDVLKFLPNNTLQKIQQFYDYSNLHIQLPLSTPLNHFKNKKSVGLISRKSTTNLFELKEKLEIKENDFIVLLALGNSNEIMLNSDDNIKFLTINTKIKNNSINVTNWIEGQDLVSVADLVICKCGYGFVSECLTNATPFYYVASNNHLEQMAISSELEKLGLKNRISLDEIANINFTNKFMKNLPSLKLEKNDTHNAINLIQEYL